MSTGAKHPMPCKENLGTLRMLECFLRRDRIFLECHPPVIPDSVTHRSLASNHYFRESVSETRTGQSGNVFHKAMSLSCG